ncbi:cytochrome P450 4C1-like [Planococcus citri]|uniref:cytochrome P450 4C1-like n=1 Tax=Planococcus citri TaxID=170843 RepID=UPI0031F9E599
MNVILISACVILIAILMSYLRKSKNKRLNELLAQFPSYRKYPLIGNAYMLFGPLDGLLSRFENIMKHDRVTFWLGPVPCLFLKKYDDIAAVFTQSTDRDFLGTIDEFVGVSIMNAPHEEWKLSKKMVAPAFSSKMLTKYEETFKSNALELIEKLKPIANSGKEIDTRKLMLRATLDVLVETLYGVSTKAGGKVAEDFCGYSLDAVELTVKRIQMPWLTLHYINKIYLWMIGKPNCVQNFRQYPTVVLKKNIEDYKNSRHNDDAPDEDDDDKSKSLIDSLVRYSFREPNISETRIRDELLGVLGAGIQSSPLTSSFIMLMLAMHQDIQQKAYEEVLKFKNADGTLNQNDIFHNMTYLEQCIKESLRMYSPVAITDRRLHKDVVLKDNKVVPANTLVVALIAFANYDPDLYKNPEVYDPEHFNEEAVRTRPKTSELTFGIGGRSCVAGKYAMMFNKTQIAYILLNYHLSTSVKEFTKEHLCMVLAIESKIGYPIKFTSRR